MKRALGYEYEEVKEKYENGFCVERTITKKEVVPDTTAQIFWLKNRKPDEWRDKQTVEIPGLADGQSKLAELLEQRRMRRDAK